MITKEQWQSILLELAKYQHNYRRIFINDETIVNIDYRWSMITTDSNTYDWRSFPDMNLQEVKNKFTSHSYIFK